MRDKHSLDRTSRRRYVVLYTIVFIIAFCCVYFCFWKNGKTFLWGNESGGDGLRQHYTAFIYFGQWGRELLYNLFVAHQLTLPTWDFSIGYGADILNTLQYYVIGDPLNLLSLATPPAAAEYVFCALVPVRLYLAGFFFSRFCFRLNKGQAGTLCAAISYVFCGFALYAGVRHPYFLNPMVYLPLLLLGVERVLHREKPWPYILAVFLAAVSNFYFFYTLVIFTVLYAVFRYFMLYPTQRLKQMGLATLRLSGYALIGVAMAAVILVPVMAAFFGDNRLASDYAYDMLYHFSYYESLLKTYLTVYGADYWNFITYTPGMILAVFFLFFHRGKEHRALKIGFLLLTAFFLLPECGRILNGFSYVTNRWCWAYCFLSCLVLAAVWPDLLAATRRELRAMAIFVAVLAVVAMAVPDCRTSNVFVALLLVAGVLLVLFCRGGHPMTGSHPMAVGGRQYASGVILLLTVVSVTVSAFFLYSPQEGNLVAGYGQLGQAQKRMLQTEDRAVEQAVQALGDTSFSRYGICSGLMGEMDVNSAMRSGLHSIQYYWSLSNENVGRFLIEMNNRDYSAYRYSGLDDRTALMTLASVGYYTLPVTYQQEEVPDQYVPYGYELVGQYCVNEEEVQKRIAQQSGALSQEEETRIRQTYGEYYNVYQNTCTLPLGYTYDSWMSRADYDKLSAVEKQEALLERVVLEEPVDTVPQQEAELHQQSCGYELTCGDGVIWQDGRFTVTSANAAVTLTLDGAADSETYVSLEGLTYQGISPLDWYTAEQWQSFSLSDQLSKLYAGRNWEEGTSYTLSLQCDAVTKSLVGHTNRYTWYNNREDYVVNLGYRQEGATQVTITFADVGVYTCDSLQVLCQPMDQYRDQVSALAEDTLEAVEIGTNQVTGTITLDRSKVLCLSIPYSSGWTAYVDGQETPLLQANTMYMALPLAAGTHTIELRYTTQGLKAGAILSAAGILTFCCVLLCSRRNKGRKHNEETHTLDSQSR